MKATVFVKTLSSQDNQDRVSQGTWWPAEVISSSRIAAVFGSPNGQSSIVRCCAVSDQAVQNRRAGNDNCSPSPHKFATSRLPNQAHAPKITHFLVLEVYVPRAPSRHTRNTLNKGGATLTRKRNSLSSYAGAILAMVISAAMFALC